MKTLTLAALLCLLFLATGCPAYEVGFTQSIYRVVESDFTVDPANCEVGGNTTVCTRPGKSDVMIDWRRDEAGGSDVFVSVCTNNDCTVQYRLTCDLAGCERHFAPGYDLAP